MNQVQQVRLFLSAVSEEFRSYRDALRNKLQRPNVTVHVQEDFIATGTETLDKLDLYIRDCDAIIHLIGDRTGAWVGAATLQALKARYPDLVERLPLLKPSLETGQPPLSYTQWEAYLGVYHRKTLLIAVAAPDAPRDRSFPIDQQLQTAQHDHCERLQQLGRYSEITFKNKDELIAEISFSTVLDLLAKASNGPQHVSNIPIRVPKHFLGREDALSAIEEGLGRYEGRIAITALHGLRGVGKTTLAAVYAERHRADYRATWWIRAHTPDGLRADLVGLGVRLGWVAADEKEEPALAVVMERLRHEADDILLVYDNAISADQLKPYLPTSGSARVLITSNAHAFRAIATPIEIRLWPNTIGADYFIARTGRERERAAAEALSDALEGLPLAHEQAAAYCERLECSIGDYQKRFEAAPGRMLDDARDASSEYHDRQTVAKTFALAIEEAAKLHPAAEPLIVYASLFVPEPIPLFLFAEAREKLGEALATEFAADGLDEAVAALRAFALVDRGTIVDERDESTTTDTIRLHRLVRQVAEPRDGMVRRRMQRALVAAIATVYPENTFNDAKSWPRARRLDALALALVGGEAAVPKQMERTVAVLLNRLARYRQGALAAYSQARPLFERALAIRQNKLGPEHAETATSLNNLALLLWAQGDLAGARPLFERALAIREKNLGDEHPDTALTLNNLGVLLQEQGDLKGARPLKERALAIRERVLGPQHPQTATSLLSLALLLREQGDPASAEPLCKRSLEIRENKCGAEHPDTAMSLIGLALLRQEQGDPVGAWPLSDRALAIREKVLGPEHPDTATSLSNRGSLLQEQGDLAEAKPLFERALAIHEKVLGSEHSETAGSLNNLALMLQAQGDLTGARPLFERALAIREKVRGPEHLHTAISLNNLARLLQDQEELVSTRPVYERALAICQKVLGSQHPTTNRVRRNLSTLLLGCGSADQALPLGEAALAAHDQVLGRDRNWTKDSARATTGALDALGRTAEAAALRERYGIRCKEGTKEMT
jgi:tetratricopeptide (TPR) repeat protein